MGIYAFDRGWQFPAITEQHALHRMRALGGAPPGTAYVAYPWATLIDKVQVRAADAEAHLDSFRAFCLGLPEAPVKVTVCQHILMRDHAWLVAEAGVRHVFWSHTTRSDPETAVEADTAGYMSGDTAGGGGPGAGLRLHPFPLYPVQIPHSDPAAVSRTDRRWLFSFVGMRPNGWYLTQVRAWIIDRLGADPRGHVIARDDWHYKQIVYRHQVLDRAPRDAQGRPVSGLVDETASAQFRDVLQDSTFALCPSGTGPNSIRLWEAMMAGSIPVIIADTYAPPGDRRLWEAAAVVCLETEAAVAALPDRLAALARDPVRMADLRAGLARLRLLYGPHGFVPDVAALMQGLARLPPEPAPQSEAAAVRVLLGRVTARLLGRRGAVDLPRAEDPARAALPAGHPVLRHHDRLTGVAGTGADTGGGAITGADTGAESHAQAVHQASPPSSPPRIGRGTLPAVHLAGPGLTPLHHPALRRLAEGRIAFAADPARADLIVAASLSDLAAMGPADPGRPDRPARLILSEAEAPVADGGGDTGAAAGAYDVPGPVWLSHANSDIFDFDRLPYALVRDDHTLPLLAGLLAPERDLTARALRDRWQAAPARAALWWPAPPGDVVAGTAFAPDQVAGARLGLDGLVAAVAAAAGASETGPERDGGRGIPGRASLPLLCLRADLHASVRAGVGQPSDPEPDRPGPALAHLDKLAGLDGRAAVIGAFEATCHPDHVGITAIEAIALQARPAAVLGAGHRLRDLIPDAALIDLFGLTPPAIAGRMLSAPLELEQAEAVCAARASLRVRLAQPRDVLAERQRIVAAVLRAVAERV